MDILPANIKAEMQGNSGLVKQIRKRFLPNTQEMATLAQTAYEGENGDFEDIDHALDRLLVLEYKLFLMKQAQVNDDFIRYADEVANFSNFPSIRSAIDDYKIKMHQGINPTEILNNISKIFASLADSNRQSRVSRSGSSLMHHISYLLSKAGFAINKDFQREFILKSGCKLDFFFPNLEMYLEEPKNCCAVACQTSSNDRFRLTYAQMPHDTRNRACTAIGCSNFSEKLGPKSLTKTKLQEAKDNGVKFVILSNAIDSNLRKSKAVITYSEWFDELKSIKQFWN